MKHYLLSLTLLFSISASAQLNLQWQELGPDNMGGTIRALILDKRDGTRQTLYAGSMGGGIWKSANVGNWWSYLGCAGNYAVTCIAQSSDGTIYFGTGDVLNNGTSFSSLHRGNGIYKIDSVDQISHLVSTNADSIQSKWAGVSRIAIHPTNNNQLIAATSRGLCKSNDYGNTWQDIIISGISTGSAIDVKWAPDGNFILAAIGGNNKLVRSQDGGVSWDRISNVTNAGFPSVQGRIEIALAPTNSDIAYVSIATQFGYTHGCFKTTNRGATWDTIVMKSSTFDPFYGQGWYDNALAVSPVDSSRIFIGGVKMYTYSLATGMNRQYEFNDPYIDSASFLGLFGYVINDLNPDEIYVYSDRGIYKSIDAALHFSSPEFTPKHYGLKARDFFSVAAAKNGQVMGGSNEGRGTLINDFESMNFRKVYDEYSAFCEFSHLDTNYMFTEGYFGQLLESHNGGISFFSAFDDSIDMQHIGEPSSCGGMSSQNAPFINPFVMFETQSAFHTKDSVSFVASATYAVGDTIVVTSRTANTLFKTTTPISLIAGNSIRVPDPVQSKLFITSNCGVWMRLHALGSNGPNWFKISKNMYGNAYSYAVSHDGNTLYAGTSSGRVYRISGLNLANYNIANMGDSLLQTFGQVANGIIEGIAVDPQNDSIVICTVAGYSANQSNAYKSTDAGTTWFPLQLDTNHVPAYTCVIDANNSNNYLVGTEHGIWSSSNAGLTWQLDNGDMCDVPVYRLRQFPLQNEPCQVLYAATNARGLWRSFTLTPAGCNTSVGIKETKSGLSNDVTIYPNPAMSDLTVEFNLTQAQTIELSLLDLQGRTLQSSGHDYTAGKQSCRMNIGAFAEGIYLVRLQTKGMTLTRKVIIVH